MARTKESLPQRAEEIRDLLAHTREVYRERDQRYDLWASMYAGDDAYRAMIRSLLPPDAVNVAITLSLTAQAQIALMLGTLMEMPTVRSFTTSPGPEYDDANQATESFFKYLPPMLEAQAEPVFQPGLLDLLLLGRSCDATESLPSRMTPRNGWPDPKDYPLEGPDGTANAEAYARKRKMALRKMGTATGRFPALWRHVAMRDVYPFESPERGVWRVLERRLRDADDFLSDSRYQGNPDVKPLYDAVQEMKSSSAGRAARWVPRLKIEFWTIEDGDETLYYWNPLPVDSVHTTDDRTASAYSTLQRDLPAGGVCLSLPNPIGRPHYTFTDGLLTNSAVPGLRHKGIIADMYAAIVQKDWLLTLKSTRINNWTFAPLVVEQSMVQQQGVTVIPGQGVGQTKDSTISLKPGFHNVSVLAAGQSLRFVVPDSPAEDENRMFDESNMTIDQLGMPRSVVDPGGEASGYQYNSRIQNLMARWKPLLTNIRTTHVERVQLWMDMLRRESGKGLNGKEKFALYAEDEERRQGEWYEADFDDFDTLTLEGVYDLRKDVDEPAAIAMYNQATQAAPGQIPALDRVTARERYLHMEDGTLTEERIRVQMVLDGMQETLLQIASEKVMPVVQKELDKQYQRGYTMEDLMKQSPQAAQAWAEAVPIDSPNYAVAQQYLAQSQQPPAVSPNGQPPMAPGGQMPGPQPANGMPQGPGPAPAPMPVPGQPVGGRAAGMARNPGGPRRRAPVGAG